MLALLHLPSSLRRWLNRRKVRLQILSDLHLEVGQQYSQFDFPCAAPYLILAGDIGRVKPDYSAYLGFLRDRCCNRFGHVFLVLGNHEFYGGSYPSVLDAALALEHEPELNGRLTVLHRRRVDIPQSNITILGCTLHSFIPSGSVADAVKMKIRDFQRIEGWTIETHNAAHDADVRWLKTEIKQIRRQETEAVANNEIQPRKIVIVTHFAPCIQDTSHPSHSNNSWSSAFATDLLPRIAIHPGSDKAPSPLSDVQWWVFGHTHFNNTFTRGRVKLISNQRGYVFPGNGDGDGEQASVSADIEKRGRFHPDAVIDV